MVLCFWEEPMLKQNKNAVLQAEYFHCLNGVLVILRKKVHSFPSLNSAVCIIELETVAFAALPLFYQTSNLHNLHKCSVSKKVLEAPAIW